MIKNFKTFYKTFYKMLRNNISRKMYIIFVIYIKIILNHILSLHHFKKLYVNLKNH